MHNINKLTIVSAMLLALAACTKPAAPAADVAADEAALRAGTDAWVAAYNGGDAAGVAAWYATDAILMPPDKAPVAGPAAIREFMVGDMAGSKAAGVKFVLGEAQQGVSGNLGWHSGVFKVTGSSDATVATGKFLETWRKADGKWLLIRDIWNMDAAPPPAAAPAATAAPGSTSK